MSLLCSCPSQQMHNIRQAWRARNCRHIAHSDQADQNPKHTSSISELCIMNVYNVASQVSDSFSGKNKTRCTNLTSCIKQLLTCRHGPHSSCHFLSGTCAPQLLQLSKRCCLLVLDMPSSEENRPDLPILEKMPGLEFTPFLSTPRVHIRSD